MIILNILLPYLGDDHTQPSPHTPPHLKDDPIREDGGKVDLDQVIKELNNIPDEKGATSTGKTFCLPLLQIARNQDLYTKVALQTSQ